MWPIYGNIWLKLLYYLVRRFKETCLILVTLAATELTRLLLLLNLCVKQEFLTFPIH